MTADPKNYDDKAKEIKKDEEQSKDNKTHKDMSPHDNEDLEFKYNQSQIGFMIRDLSESTKRWDNKIQELGHLITNLHAENYSLNKLPDKIKDDLRVMVKDLGFDIAAELKREILADHEQSWQKCNDDLNSLGTKIKEIEDSFTQSHTKRIRKGMLTIVCFTIFSIVATLTSMYLMRKVLPHRSSVHFDKAGDVEIKESEVYISNKDGRMIKLTDKK